MENEPKIIGSLKGIVQSLEQKSGLNPILFLDGIFGAPSIVAYGFKGQVFYVYVIVGLILVTVILYTIAFFTDKPFLRSEKHVYDMRRLDVLGEKGFEISEEKVLTIPAVTDPDPDVKMIEGKNK